MAVTGAILPKQYVNAITRHEQKKEILYHTTSVGNKQKQIEDRNFFISNIVSIVSSPSKKVDKNEVHTIKYLLQCSISSAYCLNKTLLQNVDI